jgi:hypothetical protein
MMLEMENKNLKRKVNRHDMTRNKTKRKVVTNARMLTSEEGLRFAEEQEAEQEAKKRKKDETTRKRLDKEVEKRQQRAERDPNEPFKGSLASKNKGDLQEIAGALCLPEAGTVNDLQTRIMAHFDTNSHLHDSPLFSGLFGHTRPSWRSNTNNNSEASTCIPTSAS